MTRLAVRDLVVRGPGRPAVHLEWLDLRAGDVVVILGGAGAGKSTLLDGLAGWVPAEGSIELDGVPIEGFPPERRARAGLAHCPQGGTGFGHALVGDLLRLAGARRGRGRPAVGPGTDRPRTWSRAELDLVLPGLVRLGSAPASSLGAWERCALSLAVALATSPGVLLADEPGAGLGDRSLDRLRSAIAHVAAAGTAVVLATRDAGFARSLAVPSAVVEDGRVVVLQDGTHPA